MCAGEMLTAGTGTGWGTDEAMDFLEHVAFWYYTEPGYRNFAPEITARFQSSRLVTTFPSQWHTRHNIPHVTANLIALKDPMPRNGGTCFW